MDLRSIIKLIRPHHWIKNGFVFAGIFFSKQFTNLALLSEAGKAALAFCFISSAIYIMNDLIDLQRDKLHPKKKTRPLCSGKVLPQTAVGIALFLCLLALFLSLSVSFLTLVLIFCYIVINFLYSLWLKHIVILDVFCIASGFMLRLLVGTVGVGIAPSEWLLLCGLMLTLFLGFTKRRAEVAVLKEDRERFREVLSLYPAPFLDELIAICAAGVIIGYCLYTVSPDTIAVHETTALFYTAPFVIYGIFRYLFLLHNHNQGEDPASDVLRDGHMLVCVSGWAAVSYFIMHK